MDLEEHGQPVTYRAIGQKIGIPHPVWLPYVHVIIRMVVQICGTIVLQRGGVV